MGLRIWLKLSTRVVHRNPWWTYLRDECRLPSGARGEYHYVHTNGSAMVVPVLADGSLLLVNQYRYLRARESLEFPCGSVKEGAGYEDTAVQELAEETGYRAGRLQSAGSFNPYNGVTDEICRVYLAHDLRKTGGEPDPTEEFELVPLAPHSLEEKIRSGMVWDGMTIAAWHLVRHLLDPACP
ncbi:MAG: NUDIX hydrolase [Bacteroidota bacterium]